MNGGVEPVMGNGEPGIAATPLDSASPSPGSQFPVPGSLLPDIQFAVLRGRPSVNRHLRRFGAGAAHYREMPGSADRRGIPDARNAIVRWFRDETRMPWLVMCDDDVVFTPASAELFACEADVASPRIVAADGREAHPHTISAACVKVSRAAVVALGEPWFAWPAGSTSSPPGVDGCECQFFFARCRQAGLQPVRAGAVGHRIPVTVLPGPVFLFDSEIAP